VWPWFWQKEQQKRMKIKKIIKKILGPIFLEHSKIVSNEKLSPHFHLLTIKGSELKKIEWIAGQKVKLSINQDESRSYTPLSWDSQNGIMKTLIYTCEQGPGAVWARDVHPQTKVSVHGPKSSVVVDRAFKNVLFFGDETTFGLAHALKKNTPEVNFHFYFETAHIEEAQSILKTLELNGSKLSGLNQFESISKSMLEKYIVVKDARIILAGKQQSIVALREHLYSLAIPPEIISKKVYWGWKDDPNGKLKK
jgi:ferric-chelate reductase (NADPH)